VGVFEMAGTVVFIESVSNDGGDPGATVSKVIDGTTNTGWISSASVATNTDNFLLSPSSISDKVSNAIQTGYGLGAGLVGEPWNFSSGGSDEGNHIFMIASIGGTADTHANGGFGIIAADDLATDSFGTWYVGPQAGSLAGWEYFVRDPESDFDAVTAGSGSWTLTGNPAQLSGVDGIGVRWKVTNTVMGASDNAWMQSMSIGVGYRITGSDAVFSEISDYEETNRYGALQTKSGTLFPLCKIRIGTPSGAGNTTFTDSGFNVTWQGQTQSDGTTKATAIGFYGVYADEGTGTTDITLSNGSLAAASPEEFDIDFSGVNSVTATNLNADRARVITLDSAVSWNGGTIKNSGQIDAGNGADLSGGTVIRDYTGAADTAALLWDVNLDPDGELDDLVIDCVNSTNAVHAIEFGSTAPLSMTVRNITATGFNAADGNNDSTFLFADRGSDVTWNLSVVNGTGNFSFKKARAGDIVNIIIDPITVQATATLKDGTAVENARVFLRASDGTGPFPYQDAVTSITRSGTTATVTTTSPHGMASLDKVFFQGITDKTEDNSRVVTITVTGASTFTFTTTNAGSTSYTGTILVTFVALNGLTNASGVLNTSRVYSSNQPLVGWTRKSSASPYLQEGVIVGEVDSTLGFFGTGVMLSDE
jgi:hypothetical protein